MESLGSYLKSRREARGVPLYDVVRETRIPRAVVEALEEDRYEALPAPVFTRGFIRGYLRHLGLNPDEALGLYQAGVRPAASTPPPGADARKLAWRGHLRALACLASAAVLSLALYVYGALTRPASSPREIQPVAARAPAETPSEAPREEATPRVVEALDAAALHLVVRATEPTWLQIETDEGRTIQELLPAHAVREWSAQSRFTLTVGNAGGIQLELNGRPLPPLGRSGEVIRNVVLPGEPAQPAPHAGETRP